MKNMKLALLLGLLFPSIAFAIPPEVDRQLQPLRNLLLNPGFEASRSYWTASAGSFSTTTTAANVGEGKESGSFTASASGQTLSHAAVTIPSGLYGRNCLGEVLWKGGDANLTLEVTDGTNVITSQALYASTGFSMASASFVCPSSGSLTIRVKSSAAAATVYLDRVYLGENYRVGSVTQAKYLGSVTFGTDCSWTTNSGSFANYAADSTCTISTTGTVQAPATNVPGVRLQNGGGPGRYLFKMFGGIRVHETTSSGSGVYRFSDGTNGSSSSTILSTANGAFNSVLGPLEGGLTYTNSFGDTTIQAQAFVQTASQQDALLDCSLNGCQLSVYYFPTTSEASYRPETVNWHVDANIGGANPAIGTGSVATYSAISDPGLDIVTNPGSIPVQIACSGTNPSTGSTCAAGSEELGIAFNLPAAGDVRACVAFTYDQRQNGSTRVSTAFELVETPNASDSTITSEGGGRFNAMHDNGTAASYVAWPITLCGDFHFTSSGQKTLRLMFEQLVEAGSLSANTIDIDRLSTVGQRDMHWEVFPINQNTSPVLVGPRSEVWVTGDNNRGSTNTAIRRLTTIQKNVGTAITYTDSATAGGSFTINETGIYGIAVTSKSTSTAMSFGVSLNSTQLTTDIDSISASARIALMRTRTIAGQGNMNASMAVTLNLNAGDVIRYHSNAADGDVDTDTTSFRITKVNY